MLPFSAQFFQPMGQSRHPNSVIETAEAKLAEFELTEFKLAEFNLMCSGNLL
jgi:hypothetical protein